MLTVEPGGPFLYLMRSVAAVLIGVIVLFGASFAVSYTFEALSLSGRGLTGPVYAGVIWGAGLSAHAVAGYGAARMAGRNPYVHAFGVGVAVAALAFGPSLLPGAVNWWTIKAADINLFHLPGLLAGAWVAWRRGG
ncbi:MAG: hypothetical protein ABFS14_10810 [Gemmatimonadota bacterium]